MDGVLIAVVIAAVVIAVMLFGKKKEKKKIIKVDLEDEVRSTIHFSDDFKSSDPEDVDHTIITIYRNNINKKVGSVWTCPNCEVENNNSQVECAVCHYKR